jgi:branched-chain amino acid transport system substrate-binding protein
MQDRMDHSGVKGSVIRRRLTTVELSLVVVATGFLGYRTAAAPSAASEPPLKLGVLFPFTGDSASYGVKGRRGVELAVDELNIANSCGRPTTAIFEDSAAQPTMGLSAFQKLISADRVPAVIGDLVSSVVLAIAPTANRTHTVVLSPTASAPAVSTAGEYIYRIWPSDLLEGRTIAEYAVKQNFRRAAILYINNDYGSAVSDVFKNTFSSEGREVIASEAYLENNQDFRSALFKLRTLTPDVLYVAGYYSDSATIIRQARELGFNGSVLGTTAIEDPKFLELAGSAADGVIYPLATGFDPGSSDPRVSRFLAEFQRRFNGFPGWVEAQAYDAVSVICTAAATIRGTLTGATLKAALDNSGAFKGVTGTIKFDEHRDVVKPIRLRIIQHEKFVNLEQ